MNPIEPGEFIAPVTPISNKNLTRRILWGNAIKDIPPPQPLIESDKGFLDLGTTGMLYGGTGQYKSFLVNSMASCISTGHPWFGHRVHQGNVLYFVGEGYVGTGVRLDAWQEYHGISLNPPIAWLDGVPNITLPGGRKEILDWVAEIDPVLCIIDTIARAITGQPENDFGTMSSVVDVLTEVSNVNGCMALGVHHASDRSEDIHARGHSAFDCGVDTMLQFHDKKLIVEKQKHHEGHYTFGTFTMKSIAQSIILDMDAPPSPFSANQRILLEALDAIGGEAGYTDLKNAAKARGLSPNSFSDVLDQLVKKVALATGTTGTKKVYRRA